MNLLEAKLKLLGLNIDVLQTSDAAAALNISIDHASQILRRLSKAGFFVPLARGKWACHKNINPYELPEYLTGPAPSYISVHSALYHHGMISQIPATIYAVSLARTRKYKTPLGHISIHHIQPSFFFGFEVLPGSLAKMASVEKALLDFFYLSSARSHLFSALPELELPQDFKTKEALNMIEKIESPKIRSRVQEKFLRHVYPK
jgi:Predicted transcriptional regulator